MTQQPSLPEGGPPVPASRQEAVVIIPTYNEAGNIDQLIADLLALPGDLQVVVVDDNSPDGTGHLADAWAARCPERVNVVHRPRKLGLGTAHVVGWRWALAGPFERILTMDADYSHHPNDVPRLLAAASDYDAVIGSRYVPGGAITNATMFRRALSAGANWLARAVLGVRAHDLTAAFRCYRRAVLESLPFDAIRSDGYSFPIETAYLIEQRGWRVGEVPIHFENRTRGRSKVSRREIVNALITLLRLGARRLRVRASAVRRADAGR
jgi:glycosyltransferase involved in cell wall biosynthesis